MNQTIFKLNSFIIIQLDKFTLSNNISQQSIFLIPNCLPLLYNATLLLPLCLNTQKMGEKTGFICARYPKWSKIYNFDPLPVLLALMGEPFLKRMAPNFLW